MLDILWSGRHRPSAQGSPEPEATAAADEQAADEAGHVVGREATSGPPASPQGAVDGQGPLAESSSALAADVDSATHDVPPDEGSEAAAKALAEQALGYESVAPPQELPALPRLTGRGRHGRRLVPKEAAPASPLTPQQRLLLLDTWRRSGLPAKDFAALVGLSKHTLYAWQKKFTQQGPAGLMDQPRAGGRKGVGCPT